MHSTSFTQLIGELKSYVPMIHYIRVELLRNLNMGVFVEFQTSVVSNEHTCSYSDAVPIQPQSSTKNNDMTLLVGTHYEPSITHFCSSMAENVGYPLCCIVGLLQANQGIVVPILPRIFQ